MKHLLRLLVLAVAASWSFAQVSTPQTIKVQGFLNQGGSPANGTFTMVFTLHDAQFPGGSVVATASPQSVTVNNGLYEVDLQLTSSAFTGSSRYLEITVNGETLTPRMQMVSAPFAYQAEKLDGFEGADFVKKAGDTITGSLQVAGTIYSTTGGFRFPDGTVQTTAMTATCSTLDQAYDCGGPGAGRTITADSGPLSVLGSGGLRIKGSSLHEVVLAPGTASPDSGFLKFGDGTGWSLHFGKQVGDSTKDVLLLTDQGKMRLFGAPATGSDIVLFPSYTAGSAVSIRALSDGRGQVQVTNSGQPGGALLSADTTGGTLALLDSTPAANAYVRGYVGTGLTGHIEVFDGNNRHVRISGNAQLSLIDNGVTKISLNGINGTTTTRVLSITGGSDLAEPFLMSDPGTLPAGALVIIDDANPGQLTISDRPYDHRVAGIISGAGGIKPGLTLSQEDVADKGQHVALVGRVYAFGDASNGPIEPGSLLTSSSIPGHVMKVTDYQRGQGAVVGKAMSNLVAGTGLVLVLVNLQ